MPECMTVIVPARTRTTRSPGTFVRVVGIVILLAMGTGQHLMRLPILSSGKSVRPIADLNLQRGSLSEKTLWGTARAPSGLNIVALSAGDG